MNCQQITSTVFQQFQQNQERFWFENVSYMNELPCVFRSRSWSYTF
jgi:hypothetical protein